MSYIQSLNISIQLSKGTFRRCVIIWQHLSIGLLPSFDETMDWYSSWIWLAYGLEGFYLKNKYILNAITSGVPQKLNGPDG